MKNIFLSLFAVAVLASCSSVATTKAGSKQPAIAGTHWVLGENVKGTAPTLNVEAGKITGNAGCNNYFGELIMNTSNGSFSAGNVGSTKKMCENMSVEQNFLQMLSQANKYVVNGSTLELYRDNLLLMKLNKAE